MSHYKGNIFKVSFGLLLLTDNGLPLRSLHGRQGWGLDESGSKWNAEHQQIYYKEGDILLREKLESSQVNDKPLVYICHWWVQRRFNENI